MPQHIRVAMPEASCITGKLTGVQPEGLILQIQKTTNKTAYPKGRFVVPRSQVKTLDVLSKRKRFRVIGTICGAWIGLGAGSYAALHTNSAGAALATLAGVGGGLTTLGYFLVTQPTATPQPWLFGSKPCSAQCKGEQEQAKGRTSIPDSGCNVRNGI